jgi:CRISPR-associated endoribonuclease Cas6/Csy4 subtype I-F
MFAQAITVNPMFAESTLYCKRFFEKDVFPTLHKVFVKDIQENGIGSFGLSFPDNLCVDSNIPNVYLILCEDKDKLAELNLVDKFFAVSDHVTVQDIHEIDSYTLYRRKPCNSVNGRARRTARRAREAGVDFDTTIMRANIAKKNGDCYRNFINFETRSSSTKQSRVVIAIQPCKKTSNIAFNSYGLVKCC